MGKTALVLAAVMGAGLLAGCGGAPSEPKAQYNGVKSLPESLSADGSMIVVGDPQAPMTLRVYEDLTVAVCRNFETTDIGPDLRSLMLTGEVKTEYVFSSVFDDDWEEGGALWVINALRAALEQDRFAEYHKVIAENYTTGGYTKTSLVRLASRVPGLRTEAFENAVVNGEFSSFVADAEKTFDEGAAGAPTLVIDGKELPTLRQTRLYGEGRLIDYIHNLQ
ncbi:thioredoxin domain-containing protein [Streptomyces flavidovirens]|uniref:thioredoxin domain-containing protein n=1 Tax=Streptomyces flavidovirens TaxID=67298 RepID=UPI0033A52801